MAGRSFSMGGEIDCIMSDLSHFESSPGKLTCSGKDKSEMKVSLKAHLSPVLKMMAVKPVGRFLELLINEMESFRGWKEIKE